MKNLRAQMCNLLVKLGNELLKIAEDEETSVFCPCWLGHIVTLVATKNQSILG